MRMCRKLKTQWRLISLPLSLLLLACNDVTGEQNVAAVDSESMIPFAVTLEEATWMSVDISPDGATLVFDILGDLYTLPREGGEAQRITKGPAYDAQPRFSPDGKQLVFVSDRNGSNNLWLADKDGGNLRNLTQDQPAALLSPEWTADGRAIVANRRADGLSDSTAALYQYDIATGQGVKLLDRREGSSGAAVSSDGRWLYYSRDGKSIERFSLVSRQRETVVKDKGDIQIAGGAMRPALSPDGRWLAFGRRMNGRQHMVLHDLRSGAESVLDIPMDWDQRDNLGGDGDLLPGYSFTPDSRAIVYSAQGKLRHYDLAKKTVATIPFKAHFSQKIHRPLRVKKTLENGMVQPKLLRWAHQSPDRKWIIFNAAGKNYRFQLATKTVEAIGDGPGLEYSPALSPDGRWLAYVSWSDSEGGHVYKTSLDGGNTVRLTQSPGLYEHLAWSPEGDKLVFVQQVLSGANLVGQQPATLSWLPADGGGIKPLLQLRPRADRRQHLRPSFNRSGSRVYFAETPHKRGPTFLSSVALDGKDKRRHLKFTLADDIMPSPDGNWVAFTRQHEVYVTALPPFENELIEVAPEHQPAFRLSEEGGYFVNWTADGKALTWSWGNQYFRMPFAQGRFSRPEKTVIDFSEPRAKGSGALLLSGARLITMGPRGVIESGDILIVDDRIEAIEPSGSIRASQNATVIDVTGKTIIPGLIDTHWHYKQGRNAELFPQNDWGYVAQLAYGVTTVRNPSTRAQMIFTQAEMIEMGRTLGPRIYSTGEPVYFLDRAFAGPPQSLSEARVQARRLKKLGATAVKQYKLPRREQRQWLLQVAREEELLAITEGASKFFYDMTLIMDGFTTLEHTLKTAPLYRDIRALLVASQISYVPTLMICPNGSAEDYFYQHNDVLNNPKLLRFTPFAELQNKVGNRKARAENDFYFKQLAAATAAVVRDGGNVVLGAHGDLHGLGVHWEMWALALGGLTPLEVLRTATVNAAVAMGLQSEIGSLEAGKIADLLVLDNNPLTTIRNSDSLRYVMKNGLLWQAESMDQVWPEAKKFTGFYWQKPE